MGMRAHYDVDGGGILLGDNTGSGAGLPLCVRVCVCVCV